MALRPIRIESEIKRDAHTRWIPAEAGGLVSFTTASGVDYSTYAADPSGVNIIGIQRHDVIENDRPDLFPRSHTRRIQYTWVEEVWVITKGMVVTNFVHPDSAGTIAAGVTAYAGPSGLLTTDSSFNGRIVGYFVEDLVPDSQEVLVEGGGYYRTEFYTDPSTGEKSLQDRGYPKKAVTTPGWAKLRLAIQNG